jgi:hypothetical protein
MMSDGCFFLVIYPCWLFLIGWLSCTFLRLNTSLYFSFFPLQVFNQGIFFFAIVYSLMANSSASLIHSLLGDLLFLMAIYSEFSMH